MLAIEKVRNSKGEPIVLNDREEHIATRLERKIKNDLGFQVDVTTLTAIMKRIVDQKFFQVAPADYLPVRVGEGAWAQELLTYRSFELGGDFETGILNTGQDNGRIAQANVGVDSLTIDVINWAKSINWTLFELEYASRAGNWDIVTAKERSRKRNWDLGIQRVAFLGAKNDGRALGLLTQSGVNENTTTITKAIRTMSTTELKTFVGLVIGDYRSNCNYTAWPTHFIIPESDYNGLVSQASADFPIKSVLEVLLDAFRVATRNANFQILPLAYADVANSGGVLTKQTYTMLNYDEDSVRMDIPVDYTNTLANSMDNFSFQNTGYGQFTGVLAYRPAEMLYFAYTP